MNDRAGPLPRPRAVVFDWDNTLVDSWPVIHHAINTTLTHLDLPAWDLTETRRRIGRSMRDVFPEWFGDRWEEAGAVFHATFREVHLQHLAVLPDVPVMLDRLRAAGLPLALVSNKTGDFLRAEVAHLGWTDHFHAIIGAGDAARDKPAPEPVTMALAGSGVAAGPECWFVGDSPVDMACAAASGLTPVLLHPATVDVPLDRAAFAGHPVAAHAATPAALLALAGFDPWPTA